MNEAPDVPHEPEVVAAARVVRVALLVLRGIGCLVGLVAIAGAIWTVIEPLPVYSDPAKVPPLPTRIAHQLTFVCIGLPMTLPTRFVFGRGRRWLLGLGALLWFGPIPWDGDTPFVFLLRVFASLVAVSILAVWRTVFGLTRPLRGPGVGPVRR